MLKLQIQLFAHVKAQGSTHNGRDSEGRRLGAKAADGELVLVQLSIVKEELRFIQA